MSIGGDEDEYGGRSGAGPDPRDPGFDVPPAPGGGRAGGGRAGGGRAGTFGGRGRPRHLPGEDGDVYGVGRRPPMRSGRSLVTVVGVVVVLVAAIAFANRGGGGSPAGDDTAARGGAAAAPTAPSGAKPVTGEDGETGIPSGFPRTEAGAQSAAANYAVALGGDGMFTTESRDAIVRALFAPDLADQRIPDFEKVYTDEQFLQRIGLESDGTAPDGMTFVSRSIPAGTEAVDFNDSTARVAVWYSSLFGLAGPESESPVAESWYTTTFTLRWSGNDWKVTDYEQKDGPTPIGQDQRASSAEDMADAVERFGGLTYAR